MPWRLDGRDPDDHRSSDQLREAAEAARANARAAFDGMVQREKEQEARELEAEAARAERAERSRVPEAFGGGGCLLTLPLLPVLLLHRRWGNKGYDESDRKKPRWRAPEPPEEPYSGNGHIGRRPPPPTGCGATLLLWPLTLFWRS